MSRISKKKEWDFVIKETHRGYQNNRLQRFTLLKMQAELSKPKPNMPFYMEQKEYYLKLEQNPRSEEENKSDCKIIDRLSSFA